MTDSSDYCQREHPMSFCKVCGTWMHCRPDGEGDFKRRPGTEQAVEEFKAPDPALLDEIARIRKLAGY